LFSNIRVISIKMVDVEFSNHKVIVAQLELVVGPGDLKLDSIPEIVR
jgi:hypothetical protein